MTSTVAIGTKHTFTSVQSGIFHIAQMLIEATSVGCSVGAIRIRAENITAALILSNADRRAELGRWAKCLAYWLLVHRIHQRKKGRIVRRCGIGMMPWRCSLCLSCGGGGWIGWVVVVIERRITRRHKHVMRSSGRRNARRAGNHRRRGNGLKMR